jgi:hypothetical protein
VTIAGEMGVPAPAGAADLIEFMLRETVKGVGAEILKAIG